MSMQPNRGKGSSGSAAAKRLAEEKANRRIDMGGRSSMGETTRNWLNKQGGPDFARFEANLSAVKKNKQNNQVTSRQTIGSESSYDANGSRFRRDIPMETAPLKDMGGHGMSPKFKGYTTTWDSSGGIDLVPERKRRR